MTPGANPAMGSLRALAQRTTDLLNALTDQHVDTPRVAALLTEHGESDPRITDEDVHALRLVAAELRHVLAATTLDQAAQRLNTLLSKETHPPRLTDHDGTHPWHLHVDTDDQAPWDEWFVASTGLFLARLISERQRLPGGVCASHGCDRVFVDTAHGGARRYCSRRCATRARVAAHRRARA